MLCCWQYSIRHLMGPLDASSGFLQKKHLMTHATVEGCRKSMLLSHVLKKKKKKVTDIRMLQSRGVDIMSGGGIMPAGMKYPVRASPFGTQFKKMEVDLCTLRQNTHCCSLYLSNKSTMESWCSVCTLRAYPLLLKLDPDEGSVYG